MNFLNGFIDILNYNYNFQLIFTENVEVIFLRQAKDPLRYLQGNMESKFLSELSLLRFFFSKNTNLIASNNEILKGN